MLRIAVTSESIREKYFIYLYLFVFEFPYNFKYFIYLCLLIFEFTDNFRLDEWKDIKIALRR